ncbi:MAG: hypothetical protein CMQ34_00985 [Gammaproteobacteria bacterium]|nr:hypothetical protein [Gammaproteobacteria bacterium]|tara:strand:- start:2276 stop:3976 length:1701 start_codon:yes stop_codon:yes gene_type:complete
MTNLPRAALAALLLLALVLLVNSGVFGANWRWDDTQILLHSHQYSFWQDFLRPEVWQQFSPANLTPWLIFSFEVDMILFGLTPAAFYVHQLLAIAAAALMLYLCLGLWCRPMFAAAGAVLFVVGLPTMLVAEQLMTRHYIEGLVFALIAVYAFVWYLRTGKLWLCLLALLMYALAVTAKEIYVPLPALLLLLPDADWRRRIIASLPFFAVTLIYALWRGYMLGSFSGGYVDSSEYLSPAFMGDVIASFVTFPALLTGALWPVFVVLVGGLWLAYGVAQRRVPWRALLIAALVLLPLVPLVRSPGIVLADRYLLLPWVLLSFSLVWCADRVAASLDWQRLNAATLGLKPWHGKTALGMSPWLVLPLIAVVTLSHAVPVRQTVATVGTEFDVQADFIWGNEDTRAFVPSGNVLPAYWFVMGLSNLKQRISGQGSPLPVVDDVYLAEQDVDLLYTYDAGCQCMRDISGDIPARLAAYRQRLRPDAELSLSYDYQQGYFSWQFGPWQEGSYHVVSDTLGVLPLPPAGQLRVTLADNAPFYLRYTSPEGWVTYSQLNHVVHNGVAVEWSRN